MSVGPGIILFLPTAQVSRVRELSVPAASVAVVRGEVGASLHSFPVFGRSPVEVRTENK